MLFRDLFCFSICNIDKIRVVLLSVLKIFHNKQVSYMMTWKHINFISFSSTIFFCFLKAIKAAIRISVIGIRLCTRYSYWVQIMYVCIWMFEDGCFFCLFVNIKRIIFIEVNLFPASFWFRNRYRLISLIFYTAFKVIRLADLEIPRQIFFLLDTMTQKRKKNYFLRLNYWRFAPDSCEWWNKR